MTRKSLLAAALVLAAASCALGLLLCSTPGGSDGDRAQQQARPAKPLPAARPLAGSTADRAPPAFAPQVAMEPDPVGPLVLEGQVLDPSDDPVGGATILLSSNPPRTATSESDGSFSFDKLVPRSYAVIARSGDQVGGPVLHSLRADSEPVIIRLAQGTSIEVTVVAAAAGTAIAGAAVALRGDESLRATTDSAGVARLRGVAATPIATVEARADGHAPGQMLLRIPDSPGAAIQTRIELRRGAAVSGAVVDEQGAPVAGARVAGQDVSQPFELAEPDDQATTDAKGRFTLPAVAAGTYRFRATHPRYAPGSSEPRAVDGVQPTDGVRIALDRGTSLAGKVGDRQGAPVAWATVRVGPPLSARGAASDTPTRQVVAGERGEFELQGLPRRRLLALALSESASSPAVEVDLAATPDRRDLLLRLDVSGTIEGVVVDSAGQPIAEAQVTAYPDVFAGAAVDDLAQRGPTVDATDGDGRFALRGLPDGNYRLQASRSGAGAGFGRPTTKAATGATGVRLVLERDGRIRGRVQFEDGSAPGLFTVAVGMSPPLPVANKSGAFELGGVAPGTHDLHVRGPDFSPAVVRGVAVQADRERDVGVVHVERGRSVSGRVLGAGGSPVAGATVVLAQQIIGDGRSLATSLMSSFGDQVGMRRATSDAGGRYAITGIGSTVELIIAAEHETEGRSLPIVVPVGRDSPAIDLQLLATGSVAGVVTAGNQPAAAQVIATSPAAAKQNVVVSTGADGRYQIERLAAGEYKLSATVGRGMGGALASRRVRIEAGKRVQVDIDVPVGDITFAVTVKPRGEGTIDSAQVFLFTGAVAATTGKELTAAVLSAGAEGGVKHQLGPAAAPFTFTEMRPGAHSLCVVPITGDLQDPAFAQRLMENVDKLKVYCEPRELAAAPAQQSYTAAVPPMQPFE